MSAIWDLFSRGGPVMWPILAASLLALTVAVERSLALRRSKIIPLATVRQVQGLLAGGRVREAAEVCRHDGGPFARIVFAGLEWWEQGTDAVREAIEDAGRREAPVLMRWLGVIGTVASVSPLMGLLGTVLGMIKVFRTISLEGPGQGQGLSAGIAEALITTAFGLAVAIPALIVFNLLSSRAERLILDIEEACHGVLRELSHPAPDRSHGPGESAAVADGVE
ncbi:MAG: MotA/TolQ/ExbB proton channel family protein [Acidobacteriota bacterium]|nr:MotA/TolQ/ExbB proton channel family protein [Acidobacteriota bacterium]